MGQRLDPELLFEAGRELAGQPRRRPRRTVGHADIIRPQYREFPQRLFDPRKTDRLFRGEYLKGEHRPPRFK